MNKSMTTRRRFLVATIAFSGITAGSIGPAALRFGSAWAQSGAANTDGALVRLARLMLPHEGLSDDVYAEVLNDALSAAAADAAVIDALLNAQQPGNFMRLDEGAQLAAMRAIEDKDLFASILASLKTNLYAHPKVWKVINYEGPSYQEGGYLNRGAGDIDWLPETE